MCRKRHVLVGWRVQLYRLYAPLNLLSQWHLYAGEVTDIHAGLNRHSCKKDCSSLCESVRPKVFIQVIAARCASASNLRRSFKWSMDATRRYNILGIIALKMWTLMDANDINIIFQARWILYDEAVNATSAGILSRTENYSSTSRIRSHYVEWCEGLDENEP
jgi:hypothetical protein